MSAGLAHQLDRIAERVTALARVVVTLREENQAMRLAIDLKDRENERLRDRLHTARDRIERLIGRIPGDS